MAKDGRLRKDGVMKNSLVGVSIRDVKGYMVHTFRGEVRGQTLICKKTVKGEENRVTANGLQAGVLDVVMFAKGREKHSIVPLETINGVRDFRQGRERSNKLDAVTAEVTFAETRDKKVGNVFRVTANTVGPAEEVGKLTVSFGSREETIIRLGSLLPFKGNHSTLDV